jgi:hypothetical protein
MKEPIFFLNDKHQSNYSRLAAKVPIDDPGYRAAVYILALPKMLYHGTDPYINRDGINFDQLIKDLGGLSSGYRHLLRAAANLFNGGPHDSSPFSLDDALGVLDGPHLHVLVQAICLRSATEDVLHG